MEIKLEVRRARRSGPNPAISLSIDNGTTFKLNNTVHLKGSPTVKLGIDIKQGGAEISVISGEREVTPVREGADHVKRFSEAFQTPGRLVIQANLHQESATAMKEETGGGGSHEKTGASVIVEAAGDMIIKRASPEQESAPPHEVAPPTNAEKSNLCEHCQRSGATESIIQGAQAEKHNAHGENRQGETRREVAAQPAQLNLNIIGNAAPAETNSTKFLRSPSVLAGSAALVSVLSLAIHFIPPKRR